MELAKTLIRSVARAFYETRHILVIDALMIHSALPNEDLAILLGMQQKDLRKLCGKLREDKLLSVHSRQETREGQQRPIHRDYYYVDMHAAIDAIKYRVWHLTEKVKDLYRPSEEKKDYYCPRCHAKWTQLEVLDYVDKVRGFFLCHTCDGPLSRDEVSAADRAGHERHSKLMAQLESLVKLLEQIDGETIPQNDFATALSHQVPVKRDPTIHPPSMPFVPVKADAGLVNATAVRPVAVVSVADLNVEVLTKKASDEAARQEKERKAAQEQQNALPVWHTQSTVKPGAPTVKPDPSAPTNGAATAPAAPATSAPALKREDEGDDAKPAKPADDGSFDPLAAYYAEMQQERLREAAAQNSSEEEEEEDDDDDGFEDVAIAASGHTPSSSVSGGGTLAAVAGAAKRAGGSDGLGAATSGAATPTAGADLDEESPAKRARLDPAAGAKPSPNDEGESDEDEFEDAL